jgi:hypothetical protein
MKFKKPKMNSIKAYIYTLLVLNIALISIKGNKTDLKLMILLLLIVILKDLRHNRVEKSNK